MRLAQHGFPDRRQDVIIVVMAEVDRQVTVNPLHWRRAIQASGAAGTDTAIDRIQREMFDHVARPTAGKASLVACSGFPHAGDMFDP